ncbi:hypothetical protein PV395_35310, partial [Streptomyces scabiei]|nr:hypothetical protein [Streptomyces scabiei]
MNEVPARLLPTPPERDVPPDRLAHHKDRLMRLIDDDRATAPAVPAPPAPRSRPRLPRPALWLPAAAPGGAAAGGSGEPAGRERR